MKKIITRSEIDSPVKLHVEFYPYERYEQSGLKKANIGGNTLLDALKTMVDNMGLYIDSNDIEDEQYTPEEVISNIANTNGDGCDFIVLLKDMNTGQVFIDEDYDDEEEW